MIQSNGTSPKHSERSTKPVSDEVERLIWNYLDGTITEGKTKVLHGMIERSKAARLAYVHAVEAHFGIADMFRARH